MFYCVYPTSIARKLRIEMLPFLRPLCDFHKVLFQRAAIYLYVQNCMLPIFQEAKEDFAKIVDFLKR